MSAASQMERAMDTKNERFYCGDENFLFVARNVFPRLTLQAFRNEIEEKRKQPQGPLSDREQVAADLGVASNSVRLNFAWYDIWKQANLERLKQIIPEFQYIIFPPTIRKVSEPKGFVPWHQDLAYVHAMGNRAHRKVATCFLPLDDEPSIRPTVQFFVDPSQKPIHHITRDDLAVNQFDLDEQDRPADERCMTFDLNLGDAIFFGQLVLHRTYFLESEFIPRNSVEFRFTQPDCLIQGKDYFDLDHRSFIQAQ